MTTVETIVATQEDRLQYAQVLVELGDLSQAELEVADVLDESPEHLQALSLFTKIKHMRRQISLAVACSAQLQSKQPGAGEQARMHLESMLNLARDPAHGAGEFLALGQFQLVQKPTAYLALEEAFRLYVARRPNDACATCRQVQNRYRDRDHDVYKLAVLAEAWICELIGDLEHACQILEKLGLERGFETDIDRLMALVSLYEKSGTRNALEAAINICKYLERSSDGTAVLGRLAVLYRRTGNESAAAEYDMRHLNAYRRAMHRPSFRDVVHVAAKRFVPIERLREIRFAAPTDTPPDASRREIAIARALRGDLEGARASLGNGADLLDLKYRADLESIAADSKLAEHAIELYARALRKDPTDLHVIGWLLDRWANSHSKAIGAIFRDKATLATVLETLERAVHDSPTDHRLWRRLATLFGMQGSQTQERQFLDRAIVLERTAGERIQAIGRVQSAATYRFGGRVHGLIHEVWATRELAATPSQGGVLRREDILGNLTSEMRDNVRNTFLAVREYAQAKFPHLTRDILDYNYGYKVTKDDEPSGGPSAGLPTALTFLSLFLQRPIPQDFATTGMLVTDAHDVLTVRTVGEIEYKVEAAYHRNLRMIVAPIGNRAVLEHSGVVPRAICDEIVRYVSDLDEAVRIVFGEIEYF